MAEEPEHPDQQTGAEAPSGGVSESVQRAVLHGALFLSLGALLWLVWPFAVTLLLASLVVITSWPAFNRVVEAFGGRNHWAAAACTCLVVVVLVLPLTWVGWLVVAEATAVVEAVGDWVAGGGLDRTAERVAAWLAALPVPGGWSPDPAAVGAAVDEGLSRLAGSVVESGLRTATLVAAGAVRGMVHAIVFVGAVGSLYAHGPTLLWWIRVLAPLEHRMVDRLFARFGQFADNMALGVVATGVVQGLAAALGFALVGLPNVVLLGVASAIGSLVPMVGSAVIWMPVVASLAAAGRWVAAGLLLLWSVAVTATVDNLVRPFVLNRDLALHPMLVLLSVLGGGASMGGQGLILGPILLVFVATLAAAVADEQTGGEEPADL